MIVSRYPNWARITKQIGPAFIPVLVVAIAITILEAIDHPFKPFALPDLTISLLGAALGLLLGFRTNSAYDRWWEARKLWGQLVNSSRSLARQALSFPIGVPGEAGAHPGGTEFGKAMVYHQIAFVHALRCALRKQQPYIEIAPLLDEQTLEELKNERNVPAAILHRMGLMASEAAASGLLNEWRLQRMDETFTDLANVQGGCERIKNTPLPRQYDFYPELFVKTYCFMLPLVLVDELKLWTPLVVMVISFCFLVLNRIGKNLEDPFENVVYDTPMTSLSITIETNLRQTLGETQLPQAPPVVKGVMM